MAVIYGIYIVGVLAAIIGVLIFLCDGNPLQPTWKETLIKRCEEQHAALMRGDEITGIYGQYPPVRFAVTKEGPLYTEPVDRISRHPNWPIVDTTADLPADLNDSSDRGLRWICLSSGTWMWTGENYIQMPFRDISDAV